MTRIPKPTHIAEPWLTTYPKITPRELDYEFFPLDEMVTRNAQKIPNQNALAFEGWHITHAALNQLVNQFATALSKLGIQPHDVVLLDLPNSPQFVIAFFAILRIGAIANPIIPLNRFVEIAHQSNDSKANDNNDIHSPESALGNWRLAVAPEGEGRTKSPARPRSTGKEYAGCRRAGHVLHNPCKAAGRHSVCRTR